MRHKTTYDVIVVGGGPGGSMAAKVAAELGLSTIFFERGRKPGEKNASGCGLGPRLWRDFKFMKELNSDVCHSLRPGTAIRHYFIDKDDEMKGMLVTKPTKSVGYEPARQFITMNVYRSEFDPWLANLAVAAGAKLKTSTLIVDLVKEDNKVVGVRDENGEVYKSQILIGADGVHSAVAIKSGLRARWKREQVVLVPQLDFHVHPKNIDKILEEETLGTWWGVNFPAAFQVFFHDGFHIGLGNWLGWWNKNPNQYLEQVVRLKRFQQLIHQLDAKPREYQLHMVPWLTMPENTFTDNVMLVGDAGGFPCPLEAEGIYPAMITGSLAARTAAKAIADNDTSRESLARYEQAWKESSVGIEFETGRELVNIWRALPFDPHGNMEWFVPVVTELLSGVFDWSEPHAVRIQQMADHLKQYGPLAGKFLIEQLLPLVTSIFKDELQKQTSLLSSGKWLLFLNKLRRRIRKAVRRK
jgi:flavin-dependent dehydrogenase